MSSVQIVDYILSLEKSVSEKVHHVLSVYGSNTPGSCVLNQIVLRKDHNLNGTKLIVKIWISTCIKVRARAINSTPCVLAVMLFKDRHKLIKDTCWKVSQSSSCVKSCSKRGVRVGYFVMTFKLNMREINSPESVGLNIQISEA